MKLIAKIIALSALILLSACAGPMFENVQGAFPENAGLQFIAVKMAEGATAEDVDGFAKISSKVRQQLRKALPREGTPTVGMTVYLKTVETDLDVLKTLIAGDYLEASGTVEMWAWPEGVDLPTFYSKAPVQGETLASGEFAFQEANSSLAFGILPALIDRGTSDTDEHMAGVITEHILKIFENEKTKE